MAFISRISIFLLVILLIVPLALSLDKEYYADVNFDIKDNGLTSISGKTNHPMLDSQESQNLTSKKANLWTFNITIPENFSAFVATANLPDNAVITYIKSSTLVRIGDSDNRPFVKIAGTNESFGLIIQYTIENKDVSNSYIFPVIIAAFVLIILLAAGYILYSKLGRRIIQKTARWYNIDSLTDRQKDIILLMERNLPYVTQSFLEKNMNMPKSSLSRNIDSLARKGIVSKEQKGITNILKINESKPKI
jgi:uncharacterized membrane protein